VPKRLQLKPEHVAWINEPISFTAARFNTGDDMEKTIVTSTGPYVITWNFRRVKAGQTYDYTIKKYPSTVVADNFRYGSDKNVIVALPDDVTMVNKKSFMTPQKAFQSDSPMLTPKTKVWPFCCLINKTEESPFLHRQLALLGVRQYIFYSKCRMFFFNHDYASLQRVNPRMI
jgi:hypothetical protein